MKHFVYILKCKDGTFYTGIAKQLRKRIKQHKNGASRSTAHKRPIKLIFFCVFTNERLAARFEKYLKSHSGRRFRKRFLV